MKNAVLAACFVFLLTQSAVAADWPQYRADAARSGYTPNELPGRLALQWTVQPMHAPMPAWQGVDTRMPFDHAYHVAIADGTLVFGSSADGKVYARDAASGAERWAFFTEGPVRLAPAVWRDRVFVVSDDGFLYCLALADGELLWKKRGGPGPSKLLGNDRMVGRWPARGAPTVVDDTLYYAAGIWPTEGIYLCALDAATGEPRWINDSSGSIKMDQPHPTAYAESGVSVQGYLVASDNRLLIPTGRAVPAVFSREDGSFSYFRLQEYGHSGGSQVVGAGALFANRGHLYETETGDVAGNLAGSPVAISPERIVWATRGSIKAIGRANPIVEQDALDRKGQPIKRKVLGEPELSFEIGEGDVVSLILAGNKVVCGTQDRAVLVADMTSGKVVWTEEVDGVPLGLAVADGRLYVSTDQGTIQCFAEKRVRRPKTHAPEAAKSPYAKNAAVADAASEILATTGVTEGYCVDLGCGDGALAYELAKRTNLHIYAIDPDPKRVQAARKRLDAAGLYGVRVTVHEGDPTQTPYAKCFANLVVSRRSIEEGQDSVSKEEALRLQKPYGGWMCVGRPGAMATARQGAIADTGVWTHQYADPANTCATKDKLVRAPLNMLWFRDTDFMMPSRHGRGPAPLFREGRLFVEGLDAIRAVDAYNGRLLWEFPLPGILVPYDQEHLVGTAATGSNLCLDERVLYVRAGAQCLRLDPATGKQLDAFEAPGRWGYIAVKDGTLFGSVVNEEHIVHWAYRQSDMSQVFTESSLFFAMDARTGKIKWTFTPKHAIRHNNVAIGDGHVYLIDRPLAFEDVLETLKAKRRGEAPEAYAEDAGPATLHALDIETGEKAWSTTEDVYGTLLAVSLEHDILLMSQQHTRFKLPSEKGGRMAAFRASDGTRLWDAKSDPQGHAARPLIIGKVIYNEPGAWDLLTGERLDFHIERSYGCGIMSGCENMMLYRSATLGYVDLVNKSGTINYGGIRPGCWINTIPAGGLVLMPDATSRCTCSYLIRAWVALQPSNTSS